MSYRIIIYNGGTFNLFDNVLSIVSFCDSLEVLGVPLIKLSPNQNYLRNYYNFKELSSSQSKIFIDYYFKNKNQHEEFLNAAYFGLKYRDYKLYGKSVYLTISYQYLIKEVSAIIQAYYKYYSVACAILTAIFFSKIGLPKVLPRIREEIFGQDFLDDFFFVPAFIFTVFESTTDLLLGETIKENSVIAKAFLSFLLWHRSKSFLKIIYNKLISFGIKESEICLTL